MKKIMKYIFIVFICFCLVGCGSGVNKSDVENDLTISLHRFNPNIEIDNYEVEESFEKENYKFISYVVKASNQYADYELFAATEYEKKENWEITNVNWTIVKCFVTNYPEKNTVESAFPSSCSYGNIIYDKKIEELEKNRFRCNGEISYELEGMKFIGDVNSEWIFDENNGIWILEDEDINIKVATVSDNIVGKYEIDSNFNNSYFQDGGLLEVIKQTDKSMEVYLPSNNTRIYLDYYDTNHKVQLGLNYYQTSEYKGKDSNGEKVKATFYWKDNCINGIFETESGSNYDSCLVIFKK